MGKQLNFEHENKFAALTEEEEEPEALKAEVDLRKPSSKKLPSVKKSTRMEEVGPRKGRRRVCKRDNKRR